MPNATRLAEQPREPLQCRYHESGGAASSRVLRRGSGDAWFEHA